MKPTEENPSPTNDKIITVFYESHAKEEVSSLCYKYAN